MYRHLAVAMSLVVGALLAAGGTAPTVETPELPDMTQDATTTTVASDPESPRFTDVGSDHVFYQAIEWLADQGITRGCNPPDNDRFCPAETVTRGQLAAFLTRLMAYQDGVGSDLFEDDDTSVFEADIERLAAAGVTRGCNPPDNDHFCPGDLTTRGQLAAMLVRAFGLSKTVGESPFVDDDGSVFEDDITAIADAGITLGCNPPTNDRFCPTDPVTRGQLAALLWRAMGHPSVGEPGLPRLCWVQTSIATSECEGLLELYSATDGSNWVDGSGWLIDIDLCTWQGVTCKEGHVAYLILYANGLTGSIPPELGYLTSATTVNLASNNLVGEIPTELGRLEHLFYLDLSNNSLSGEIPIALANDRDLVMLYLTGNNLSGPLPAELGSLDNLVELLLGGNALSGPIPPTFGNLLSLRFFDAGSNSLSGMIPDEVMTLNPTDFFLRGQDGCLTAESSALADWLSSFDALWNDGCSG